MLERLRRLVTFNFVLSIAVAVVWFSWQTISGLAETDPTKLRINRVPLGAAVLVVIQVVLYALYRRSREISGLVRVFAAMLGVVQFLSSVVVAWIAGVAYDQPFPTPVHILGWYLCSANLAFAFIGPPVANRVPGASPGHDGDSTEGKGEEMAGSGADMPPATGQSASGRDSVG
jgi:hypothetical protein